MLDDPDVAFRFDIVEVVEGADPAAPEVRWIQSAFQLPQSSVY
jgi:hypothetical protein